MDSVTLIRSAIRGLRKAADAELEAELWCAVARERELAAEADQAAQQRHVNRPNPSQADASRHSKLNRKSGYHLPHKARSTPAI